jgi:hypothetical protein
MLEKVVDGWEDLVEEALQGMLGAGPSLRLAFRACFSNCGKR